MHQRTGKTPAQLDLADLDATTISAFLNHLENERGNSARTRNARLAAIHSLFGYAALRHPEHALLIQRVLAIPAKRFDKRIVTYLPPPKSTRCWPRRTRPPGTAGETRPCCCWPSRPACGSPSSPA